ncbi:MAG: DUF1572 family protein [Gemmatimonadaceae bacterium]|nr:DUF1572 family protein [Gemmatimonadaceae bacterium]
MPSIGYSLCPVRRNNLVIRFRSTGHKQLQQGYVPQLTPRFSDFLTSDGEKPSRDRDNEFEDRSYSGSA